MTEERQVRPGFLPPKPPGPAGPGGPAGPPRLQPPAPPTPRPDRPVFVAQRMESGPRSPVAMAGTILGSISLLLLFLTVGLWYFVTALLSLSALMLGMFARRRIQELGEGRAGQARAAIWVGGIGIGLSVLAFAIWMALQASGFGPEDLQQWLEEQLEQRRSRPGGGGMPDERIDA